MKMPTLPADDLDVIEGAELAFCEACDQLTLQTVDQVLEVYAGGQVSEVLRRCLCCETSCIVVVSC